MMTFAPKRFSYLLTILGGIVLFGSFIGGGVSAQALRQCTAKTSLVPNHSYSCELPSYQNAIKIPYSQVCAEKSDCP